MAEFAELGMTAVDHLTDKHGDATYERIQRYNPLSSRYKQDLPKKEETTTVKEEDITVEEDRRSDRRSADRRPHQHRHTAELPSPERERKVYHPPPPPVVGDEDYDRQSENSARVLRNYENERDDPRRKPDREYYRRDMAYNNYDDQRPTSRGAARSHSRYDDEGSDYDEHTGRRYQTSGRGYDQDRRSRDYDREIIETEVYRGPPRDWGAQRSSSYQGEQNGEYAVTQYRGGNGNSNELAPYDERDRRRSRSRARSYREDYDDRDRSRSREKGEGIRGKLEDTFDTSKRGVGAGLLGAVVGGLAGRQFGDKKHGARDMVIGAVVGGLAVNAAEQKWHQYKENKEEDKRYGYDDRDYRSRSAMR